MAECTRPFITHFTDRLWPSFSRTLPVYIMYCWHCTSFCGIYCVNIVVVDNVPSHPKNVVIIPGMNTPKRKHHIYLCFFVIYIKLPHLRVSSGYSWHGQIKLCLPSIYQLVYGSFRLYRSLSGTSRSLRSWKTISLHIFCSILTGVVFSIARYDEYKA